MRTLDIEARTFHEALPALVAMHEGQYVVIKNTELRHFSDSYEDALEWAYGEFGLQSFFVRKVTADQGFAHFTRDVGPWRS